MNEGCLIWHLPDSNRKQRRFTVTERQQAQDAIVSFRDAKPEDFKPVYLSCQATFLEAKAEDEHQVPLCGLRQLELTFD